MVKKHITTTWLDAAKPQKSKNRTDYSCDVTRGLQVRVTRSGLKTWRMVYKFEGKPQSLTLGRYPSVSFAMARQAAAAAWVKIEDGINPASEVKHDKQTQKEALTFEELASLYMDKHAKRNKAPLSIRDDQRRINVELLPAWGNKKAHDVTKKDVIALIEKVYDRGAKVESNRYLSLISVIFNWAVKRDILTSSPAHTVEKIHKVEQARKRVLTLKEIQTLWHFLNTDCSIHPVMRIIIRLLLLTGQRTSEVCYTRKSELELDKKGWLLKHDPSLEPPRIIKNKNPSHLVMLAPMALGQFKQALSLAGDSPFVFPNNENKGMPFTMEGIGKALQREIKNGKLEIAPLQSRDLRRTFKTNLKTMKVDLELRDMITNHKGNQSVGQSSYEWEDLQEERLEVMEKWEERLQDIIAGKQVRPHGLRLKAG